MRALKASGKLLFCGSILLATVSTLALSAEAFATPSQENSQPLRAGAHLVAQHRAYPQRTRGYAGSGISCVPYARVHSGIEVPGNAWQWWDNAAGQYARGWVPERGSVLAFRANGRMRLGHVAVVSRVINAREVEIDHANWAGARGGVAHNIPVVDVSETNDWTAVRVGLGRSGDFGSVYPTYGFIYDRPDTGRMVASATAPAPAPALSPPATDLRPAAERPWRMIEEVAEAPQPQRRARSTHSQ